MKTFPEQLYAQGLVNLGTLCDASLTERLSAVAVNKAAAQRLQLGQKDIGIGSKEGYYEIVQRSPGRWDIPVSPEEFGFTSAQLPWWPFVCEILAADAEHSFSGVVYSEPGSQAQCWHIDSPHESATHLPAHALNVFVALHDVPMEMGPTEFVRASHKYTNHLKNPELDVSRLLYQHADTTPELLAVSDSSGEMTRIASPMNAGSVLTFDDRLMHRGLANRSQHTRYVAYFSYRRKGYSSNTHFESKRSLYESP